MENAPWVGLEVGEWGFKQHKDTVIHLAKSKKLESIKTIIFGKVSESIFGAYLKS